MVITDQYFPSRGEGQIRARRWEPEDQPIAVVQLVHGIAEHIERYDDFARWLCSCGYLVVAQDHMGHGKSAVTKGYFSGGWFAAVADTYHLLSETKVKYPDIPYVLFGHSMGSFLTRTILTEYPECGISGAILCGTGWMPEAVLTAVKLVTNAICKLKGEKQPSRFLQLMMFGSYNHRISHPRTEFDWLTRDNKIVDAYIADQNCGFTPAAGLARDMFGGMLHIQKAKMLHKMDVSLPVLFVAGGDDPVGNYGSGVLKTADAFQKVGMRAVSTKIYPLCRHEILNEINKSEVYQDILNWIRHL